MKRFPFAPGVIVSSVAKRNLVEGVSRVVLVLVCLAAISAVLGFSAGYLSLSGLLP